MLQAPGFENVSAAAPHVITTLPVLVLHVNARCNCRCAMCDIWKVTDNQVLHESLLQSLCDAMIPLGVRNVALTGGEPFMNPALRTICDAIHKRGPSITILTSGLLLKQNVSWLNELVKEVIVSVDGTSQTHDKIRGVKGAFRQIASAVEALNRRSSTTIVRARTTVQRLNHSELSAAAHAAREIGMSSISFLAADTESQAFNRELVWPIERQNAVALNGAELETLSAEIEQIDAFDPRSFISESRAKLLRIVDHFRTSGRQAPICNAPWKSAVVELDGSVRPCFFQPVVGKIEGAKSLIDVLNGDQALNFRSSLDMESNSICKRCVCSLNYRDELATGSSSPL